MNGISTSGEIGSNAGLTLTAFDASLGVEARAGDTRIRATQGNVAIKVHGQR